MKKEQGIFYLILFPAAINLAAWIYDAAFLFFVIAFAGIGVRLYFRRDKHIWELEK